VDRRFSALAVWSDLWRELREHWAVLIQATAIPLLLTVLLEQADQLWDWPWPIRTIGGIVYALISCLFAISIHRVILLGQDALSNRYGLFAERYVLHYVGALIAGTLCMIAAVVCLMLVTFIPSLLVTELSTGGSHFMGLLFAIGLWMPFSYLLARVSIWLPARAVGDRSSYSQLFGLSRGNGWRLTIATMLPATLVALCLTPITNWLIENPGAPSLIPSFMIGLASSLILVGLLSCAYRALRKLDDSDSQHLKP
jgi:hypothetical protein